MATRSSQLGALVLCLACYACGEPAGPYETAGTEWRTSGGDEVISDQGDGVETDEGPGLAAPVENRDDYRASLEKAKARRENELRNLDSREQNRVRLLREVHEIDEKLRNVDLSYLEQRNKYVVAERTLNTFVFQFATEREWEMTYAMRAGDISLASSIVQGVLAGVNAEQPKEVEHVEIQDEQPALTLDARTPMQDLAADRLRAQSLGAEALLNLAKLAVEAADFDEAERQFRACLNYQTDLGVRADALNRYAALLELLGRKEEARKIDAITSRTLNLRP